MRSMVEGTSADATWWNWPTPSTTGCAGGSPPRAGEEP